MRVLVVHGSKHGGTEEIARVAAEALVEAGHAVDVHPAASALDDLTRWDAALVCGGLYAGFWPRAARRFVARHRDELARMPVWCLSSGPIGDAHQAPDLPPSPSVARLMRQIGARGHITLGGRLDPAEGGFMARGLARQGMAGDWRDMDAARAWAAEIAETLASLAPAPQPTVPPQRRLRRAVAALTLFAGLTAIAGGVELIAYPHGAPWMGLDSGVLRHTPFDDFVLPGLILLVSVGLLNTTAGVLALRRHPRGEPLAVMAGAAMTGWIVVEAALLRTLHPLHGLYFVVGVATLWAASRLWSRRRAAAAREPLEPLRSGDAGGAG